MLLIFVRVWIWSPMPTYDSNWYPQNRKKLVAVAFYYLNIYWSISAGGFFYKFTLYMAGKAIFRSHLKIYVFEYIYTEWSKKSTIYIV